MMKGFIRMVFAKEAQHLNAFTAINKMQIKVFLKFKLSWQIYIFF